MINGKHYSTKVIPSGSCITSLQSQAQSYKLVWGLYKQVADELGIYFPAVFGYAYTSNVGRPQFKHPTWHEYDVLALPEKVTYGHLDYSLFAAMAYLGSLTDRSIVVLADRLVDRERQVKENALRYFTLLDDPEKIEMISDSWVIQPIAV